MVVPHSLLGPSLNCDAANCVCFATIPAKAFFLKGSRVGPAQPNPCSFPRYLCRGRLRPPQISAPPELLLGGWRGGPDPPPIVGGDLVPHVPWRQNMFGGALGYPGPRDLKAQPALTT